LQKHQVFIEYLVFAGSLDEYMLNKIKSKDSIVDKSIDLIYK
jgi:hypothetical protein